MAVTTWRSDHPIELFLLRHAEAFKNLEDRHGGGNPRLTDLGLRHCDSIRRHLLDEGVRSETTEVAFHPSVQVDETVEACGLSQASRVIRSEELRGIALGNLAGLSRTEAAMRFPAEAALLEQWRSGRLRLPDLKLPGGEDGAAFYERVSGEFDQHLRSLNDRTATMLVVGTRSTLILLQNVLLMDSDFSFQNYRPWEFANGSVTRWTISCSEQPQLRYFNLVPPLVQVSEEPGLDR